MKKLLFGAPILTLAMLSANTPAEETLWRPAGGHSSAVVASTNAEPVHGPPVRLAHPVALGRPLPAPSPDPRPGSTPAAVALDRPVPLGPATPAAVADGQVRPVAYQWSSPQPAPLFRGQSPDAQPMPVGVAGGTTSGRRPVASTTSFAIDDEPLPAPQPATVGPVPTPVTPPPPPLTDSPLRPVPDGSPIPAGTFVDECPPCDSACCPLGPASCCCDGCCNGASDNYRLYGSAEYLLWWVRGMKLPPLVTTSPPTSLGVIGMPGTALLIGGTDAVSTMRSGLRGTLGWWIDPERTWAVEGTLFGLAQESKVHGASSPGLPLLARPFFNVLANAEDAELVANPLIPSLPTLLPLSGTVLVSTRSELWGAQANLVRNVYRGPVADIDLFGGFRYLDLQEQLDINEALVVSALSPAAVGTSFLVADAFHTHNQFYGGQLGARGEFHLGPWFVNLRGGVALGTTHETATINGYTAVGVPGVGVTTFPGGLLAQPTNSGRFTNNTFSVVPEAGLNIGYQVTDYARIFVGYSFLYWNNVARPGNQVDLGVNPSQIAPPHLLMGPARPGFFFKDSDFWAQGVNFGVELRY